MSFNFGKFKITINKDGLPFILIFMAFGLFSLASSGLNSLTLISIFVILFLFMFFRDPERFPPKKENVIVSPSDGIVSEISLLKPSQDLFNGEEFYKISILLLPISVKVQRSPISGNVRNILKQSLDSSLENTSGDDYEGNVVVFENKENTVIISQSTGILSRKIISYIKEKDSVVLGQKISAFALAVRYGLINLMPKIEVYIPKKNNITVQQGQTLIAGETIIAEKS